MNIKYNTPYQEERIVMGLEKVVPKDKDLVFFCIGIDKGLDFLGPLVGSLLKHYGVKNVYGTLDNTLGLDECRPEYERVRKEHSDSFIIAIDAAIGMPHEIGEIQIRNKGITYCPQDKLYIGDISVLGVVTDSEEGLYIKDEDIISSVYIMVWSIIDGVKRFLNERREQVEN
jgi:putative sporulation protein YyaC